MAAGKYRLGTLVLQILSGSPRIDIAPASDLLGTLSTSFGSNCPGLDNDNTLKLGSDWQDCDGLGVIITDPDAVVAPAPPVGIDPLEYYSWQVYLPNNYYHCHVLYYSVPSGSPAKVQDVYMNPFGGPAMISTVYGGPTTYYFWDKVIITFPAQAPGGFFNADLVPYLDLSPAANSSHRFGTKTVSPSPETRVLDLVTRVKQACQQSLGASRTNIEVRWGSKADYSGGDFMELPDIAAYSDHTLMSTVSHEYGHALQHLMFTFGGVCTFEPQNIIMEMVTTDCASHDGCTTGQSYQGSHTEGFADAISWYITRKLEGTPQGAPWPPRCWQLYPADPDMKSSMREDNILSYWYALLLRDPIRAFASYRYGRLTEVTGQTHPANTLTQFRSVWTDHDQETNRWVSVHYPGNFSDQNYYLYNIFGQDTTGVVASVAIPEPDEYEKVRWIRSISPNPSPAGAQFSVRALVPSSREVAIQVFAASGRLVGSRRFSDLPVGEHVFQISVRDASAGVYLLVYEDAANHRVRDSAKVVMLK
jgi:hypothetical protein